MRNDNRTRRRHDIDFIRVAVFALLMIYHTSLIFGTRSWLVNADAPSRMFDLIALASHPWRIGLLFLISGMTTASLTARFSPAEVRGLRSRQLIPPLLIGIFVLVPPQIYIAARDDLGLQMSYLNFWWVYLRFGTIVDQHGVKSSVVSMQHLWFLAYLWAYTAILTVLLGRGNLDFNWLIARLSRLLSGHGLFVWPIVYLAALRLVIYPVFGETLDASTDWYAHIVYFSFFVFGFLMADNETFWERVVASRGESAVIAALSLAFITSLFIFYPLADRGLAVTMLHRFARSVLQWAAIVSILGYCRVLIVRPHPMIRYLNKAMLTYYVLHQTILLIIAFWLKHVYGLGNGSFLLIVLATMASCMAFYELQRQVIRHVGSAFSNALHRLPNDQPGR